MSRRRSTTTIARCLSGALAAAAISVLPVPAQGDPAPAGALANRYTIDVWDAEDGLPQNTVVSVFRARDGYLWVATQEGVVRFDGSRFTAFESLSVALVPDVTHAMAEDAEGTLWIGTETRGLLRFRDGQLLDGGPELPGGCVLDLLAARDGGLWIGTCEAGLYRFDGKGLTAFTAADGLPGNAVKTLLEDAAGRIWVGTYDGLGVREGETFRTYRTADGLADDEIFALTEGPAGTLWIGTRSGLQRLRNGEISSVSGFDRQINALATDDEGSVWIGTAALTRFREGETRTFTAADGLAGPVRAIYPGADGGVWVGTIGSGLERLRQGSFATLGKREGLSHDMVSVLLEDDEGLWIGTWGGGVNRVDEAGITPIGIADGLPSNSITSLFRDSGGRLWIGTARGLIEELPDGGFRRYGPEDGLAARISALGEDTSGTLWVGTVDGLHRRSEDMTRFEAMTDTGHDMVHAIVRDSRGDLWVGRDRGLTRMSGTDSTVWTTDDGLAGEKVFSVHEDARGTVWIGTSGGLSVLRDGRLGSVTKRDGLCDDRVFWILEDDQERLWMSCNRGVFSIGKDVVDRFLRGEVARVPCKLYGRHAGMRSHECNGGLQPAGCRTRDGRLWFPTIEGAVSVMPADVQPQPAPPPVVLERVLLDRRLVDLGGAARAPRGRGELEFQYTAIALLDPRQVRFRYRLEGFEDEWRVVGDQRVARYTNLPPGAYRFEVSSSYGDGPWNTSVAGFDIRLRPRFYQTTAFVLSLLAGLILVGTGTWVIRTRRARAREQRLAALVEDRTRSLADATHRLEDIDRRKSEFVSGISHELKTPLTLVRLYAETLGEHPEYPAEKRAGFYRIIAREVMRLTRLVERVLDVSRIEEGVRTHRPEPGDLAATVGETVESYRQYLETRGLEVDLSVEDGLPTLRFDPASVSNAVVNLLDNAAKYSGTSTSIDVRIRRRGEAVAVEVEDRGVGIAGDDQERIFERFYRVGGPSRSGGYGIGLFLVRDIMETHGGTVEVDSEPGRGSIFRLVFPVGRAPSGPAAAEGEPGRA